MTNLASDYLILWASQTGNAEWIAKNIHTEAGKKGYKGECFVMDEFAVVCVFYGSSLLFPINLSKYRHHYKKLVLSLWSALILVMVIHQIIHLNFGNFYVATRTKLILPILDSLFWV
jgi:hypothetical protein